MLCYILDENNIIEVNCIFVLFFCGVCLVFSPKLEYMSLRSSMSMIPSRFWSIMVNAWRGQGHKVKEGPRWSGGIGERVQTNAV